MSDQEALDKAYQDMFKSIFQNYVLDQDYEKLKRGVKHLKKSRDSVSQLLGLRG